MTASQRALLTAALGLTAIAAGTAARAWSARTEVPVGTPIRHDDFFFTVRPGACVWKKVSPKEPRTKGHGSGGFPTMGAGLMTYYVDVPLEIRNDAKRVDFQWTPGTAFAEFKGRRLPREDTSRDLTIAPQTSATTTVTFVVAARADEPPKSISVGFWDGILMGDVFDGLAYTRVRVPVALEPACPYA